MEGSISPWLFSSHLVSLYSGETRRAFEALFATLSTRHRIPRPYCATPATPSTSTPLTHHRFLQILCSPRSLFLPALGVAHSALADPPTVLLDILVPPKSVLLALAYVRPSLVPSALRRLLKGNELCAFVLRFVLSSR